MGPSDHGDCGYYQVLPYMLHYSSPAKEVRTSRAGSGRQELVQRSWRHDAYWLAPRGAVDRPWL